MVANQGKITTLDVDASVDKGLVDGTDKMHSGILKTLESFAQGDMCISHAGFTITDGGSYTQYNLFQPIQYLSRGEFTNHTSSLNKAYTSTPVQDPVNSRYDWVLLDPAGPTLEIVEGTAGATPLVSDITAGFIPIALVHITAGTDDDKFDYAFQTFTLDINKKSVSIMHGGSEVGSLVGDANGITIDGLYKIDNLTAATVAGTDKILIQDADDSDIIKTITVDSVGNSNFSAKTTDDLTEGLSNFYYRKALVEAESALDLTGSFSIDGGASLEGGVVINDAGASVDFRIESNNNANMLIVDGGQDKVGIGTNSFGDGVLSLSGAINTKGRIQNITEVAGDALGPPPVLAYDILKTDDFIIAKAPGGGGPPNDLMLNLPDAGATDIGRTYRIIASDATASLQLNRTGSSDTVVDATEAILSLPYSLSAGKIYDITCVDADRWMLLQLN